MSAKTITFRVKSILLTLVVVFVIGPMYAEKILNIEKLDTPHAKFEINRNIFSPDVMKPNVPGQQQIKRPVMPPPPPKEIPKVDVQQIVEDEVRQSLFYEGYVIKHPKNFALVSSSGEFYAVTSGDVILERIKILKIDRKFITVEVDQKTIEIQLKGDDTDE